MTHHTRNRRELYRLYLRITVLNFKARMEYRGEFLLRVAAGTIWQGATVVFAGVLLARFHSLGGWNQGGVFLIAAMRLLAHSLYLALFSNVAATTSLLQMGQIDNFLLRPLPMFRQVLLARVSVNALGDAAVGVAVFCLALSRLGLPLTPMRLACMATGIAGGVLIEAALHTLLSAASFRFTGVPLWDAWLDDIVSTFGNYPLNVMPGAARSALTFAIPVAFIAYLPAAVVTDRTGTSGVPRAVALAAPLLGGALFLAAKRFWYYALRWYQSPNL